MKKSILFLSLMLLSTTALTSCNSDDINTEIVDTTLKTKIKGTWGNKWDAGTGIKTYPKFTFLENGKVKYYTYYGNEAELEEVGTWYTNGDFLIMEFPATVNLKFKNKIAFVNVNELKMIQIQEVGYDSWDDELFYKTTDPNIN